MNRYILRDAGTFSCESVKKTNFSGRYMKCLLYDCCYANEQMKTDGEKERKETRKKER
jgi:hypothetical protein